MPQPELYIGIMSGTSLDGVDTALVAIDDTQIQLINRYFLAMPADLQQRLLMLCTKASCSLLELGTLDHQLGHLYADAVMQLLAQSGYQAQHIRAIGNHGQTVFHHPEGASPFTLQLGDAHILATRTGICTVADFRRKDMALGGQGAPLVPAFHQALFAQQAHSVVVLNIGGIANISVLMPEQPVIGYDTGPGNVLMDLWCQRHRQQAYDAQGHWAMAGQVNPALLASLKSDPYFARPAPKSTGREWFNLAWLSQHSLCQSIATQDVQRTLCEFSAQTIADQVALYAKGDQPELLVCGGGAQNNLLMQRLHALLPTWQVASTQAKGVNSDYLEAMAFAWLAYRRIHHLPSNIPSVTGAKYATSLGVIYSV